MSSITQNEMETRGGVSKKFVPDQIIKHIGERIKFALNVEHLEYSKRHGQLSDFNYIRFCENTQVPYNTIRSITSGMRVPSVFDLLEVSRFTGFTCDQLLENIPNRAALRALWEVEQDEINQINKRKWAKEQQTHGLFPDE
jgi:hypothetical protein